MAEWPSSGGGGIGIYKDGTPVRVTLGSGESTSVPTGETWVLTLRIWAEDSSQYTDVAGFLFRNERTTIEGVVLTGGDTITVDGNASSQMLVTGWSV